MFLSVLLMNLLLIFLGYVVSVPDALFGGGCTVVDDNLIITAAVYKDAGRMVMSRKSYYLDLTSPLILDADSRLGWSEVADRRKIPGKFFLENGTVMYVVGSSTVEPPKLISSSFQGPLSDAKIENSSSTSSGGVYATVPINETLYLEILDAGLKLAVIYNDKYHLLRNPKDKEDIMTSFSIVTNVTKLSNEMKFHNVSLKGTPPPYIPGYSIVLKLNIIYFATENKIYTLNLDTLKWNQYTVTGFKAAQSGCLITYKDTLIHAFGKEGNAFVNRTQFIDMKTWTLKQSINTDELSESENGLNILINILIVFISLLILSILIGLTFNFIRKKKELPELKAPEYYTKSVWAEPSPITTQYCELDLSISNDGEISHDLTPDSSPLSSNNNPTRLK